LIASFNPSDAIAAEANAHPLAMAHTDVNGDWQTAGTFTVLDQWRDGVGMTGDGDGVTDAPALKKSAVAVAKLARFEAPRATQPAGGVGDDILRLRLPPAETLVQGPRSSEGSGLIASFNSSNAIAAEANVASPAAACAALEDIPTNADGLMTFVDVQTANPLRFPRQWPTMRQSSKDFDLFRLSSTSYTIRRRLDSMEKHELGVSLAAVFLLALLSDGKESRANHRSPSAGTPSSTVSWRGLSSIGVFLQQLCLLTCLPLAVAQSCSTSPIQTGYIISAGSSTAGSTRTVSCAAEYYGLATSISCQENGSWSSASGCTINAQIKSLQKVSDTAGTFTGILDNSDEFGWSVSAMADSNGDGVGDLAVGAYLDDDGGFYRGAIYVLFMASTGVVKSFQKVSDTMGSFTGILDNSDSFGISVSAMADSNGDGVGDLAVGAHYDDDGGYNRGAIYVLFMASTGVVKSFQKVSDTMGSFTGIIF